MKMPTPPEDVERIRTAVERAGAPAELRARVGEQLAQAGRRRMRRTRLSLAGAMAAATAAVVALALVLPGGGGPSVLEVARLGDAAAAGPAPRVDRADRDRLRAGIGGVSFPNWRTLRWPATGQRSDSLDGRRTRTVYYAAPDGTRLGYTIVDGDVLDWPDGARIERRDGIEFHITERGGRRIVTWREGGRQCVVSAPDSVPAERLLELAAWT